MFKQKEKKIFTTQYVGILLLVFSAGFIARPLVKSISKKTISWHKSSSMYKCYKDINETLLNSCLLTEDKGFNDSIPSKKYLRKLYIMTGIESFKSDIKLATRMVFPIVDSIGGSLKKSGLLKQKKCVHPGEALMKDFLIPSGLSQSEFADRLGGSWTHEKIDKFIKNKQRVTESIALDFANATDTNPTFWINLQVDYDLIDFYKINNY